MWIVMTRLALAGAAGGFAGIAAIAAVLLPPAARPADLCGQTHCERAFSA